MRLDPPGLGGSIGKRSTGVVGDALQYGNAERPPIAIEQLRNSILGIALDYAARGYCVFPLLEGQKEPATKRGFIDASINPATIRRWWGGIYCYNIGIRTGQISGVWVLDVDGSNGALALAELEAKHGELPPTLCSTTSAGCHFWFNPSGPLPSSVGRIAAGLDVRADGGYVLAPPSVHPDGPTYRWGNDRPPADAPSWLIELARKRPYSIKLDTPDYKPRIGSPSAYGQAAIDGECDLLAKTPLGSRNHQLNKSSFRLHQLVAGGELNAGEVRHRLIQAATANGLMTDPSDGPRSVQKTIASGARAGLQHPRRRKPR